MSLQKNIRDLIFFYVKTNYDEYLKKNKLTTIDEDKIDNIIQQKDAYGFLFSAIGGGCNGFNYDLKLINISAYFSGYFKNKL